MHPLRRLAAAFTLCSLTAAVAAGLVAGVIAGLAAVAAPASAQEGYTYWGYYQRGGDAWKFSQTGATEVTPEDGTVEGWRYATTAGSDTLPPRTDLTFDEVCEGTDAGDGEKRVAVVLDYGVADDAPDGEQPPTPEAQCAVVPEGASGQQVLDAVADVRVEDGLTCGVNGYPAKACATTVQDASVPASEEPVEFTVPSEESDEESATEAAGDSTADDTGAPWALIGVGALVVLLLVAGVVVSRRRA